MDDRTGASGRHRLRLRPAAPGDAAFLAWGLDEAAAGVFKAMFGASGCAWCGRRGRRSSAT